MTSDFFSALSTMPKEDLVGLVRDNLSNIVGTLPGVLRVLAGQTDSENETELGRILPRLIEISPQVFNGDFRQQMEQVFSQAGGMLSNAFSSPGFYNQILTILQHSRNSENALPVDTLERISEFMAGVSQILRSSDADTMVRLRDQLTVALPDLIRVVDGLRGAFESRDNL